MFGLPFTHAFSVLKRLTSLVNMRILEGNSELVGKGDVRVFEKTTRMNFLIDIYESLLTEKQKSYVSLYYLEDLSLGEIAEEFEVSRQAVYDNIKRTEAVLENYETKLGVLQKYQEREQLIEQIEQHLTQHKQLDDGVAALLQQLKNMD